MCLFLARIERDAPVAQLVEHVLGKDEVSGSIPLVGSRFDWEYPAGRNSKKND